MGGFSGQTKAGWSWEYSKVEFIVLMQFQQVNPEQIVDNTKWSQGMNIILFIYYLFFFAFKKTKNIRQCTL